MSCCKSLEYDIECIDGVPAPAELTLKAGKQRINPRQINAHRIRQFPHYHLNEVWISFCHELCKMKPTTVVVVVLVTLQLEFSGIFMWHYICHRSLEMFLAHHHFKIIIVIALLQRSTYAEAYTFVANLHCLLILLSHK